MRASDPGASERPRVEGYGPGFFRVGGQIYRGPLVLLPAGPVLWAGLPETGSLVEQAADFDVLLLGMGADIRHPAAGVREALESAGIGIEVMATGPACRTYNLLLGEGRRVAAALMPV